MPSSDQVPAQAQVDQAIEWLVKLRFDNPNPATEQQFQQWLAHHPHNAQAWQRVSTLSDELAGLPSDLSRRTLDGRQRQRINRRDHLKLLAVLAIGGSAGWAAREPLGLPALMADNSTGTGERRRLQGSDGSQIQLNTASAIDCAFSAQARRVSLIRGEIFMATAKAASPFYVETEHGRLQALGTRFNVRLDDARTSLAVYEGAVQIRTVRGETRVLGAGQQAYFSAEGIADSQAADMAREAWTQGALLADNISLREVVEELRRYRYGHLGVADEVADLRVYGNFPIQDPQRVLRMLSAALPIRIEQPLPWWTSIEARH